MYSQILSDSSPFDDNFVHFLSHEKYDGGLQCLLEPPIILKSRKAIFFNYIYIDL